MNRTRKGIVEWLLSHPEEILMKKPFTRGSSTYSVYDNNCGAEENVSALRRAVLPNVMKTIVTQDKFMKELDPDSHEVLFDENMPSICVKANDGAFYEIKFKRTALAFQERIRQKKTLALCGNPRVFTLHDSNPSETLKKNFADLKWHWTERNQDGLGTKAVYGQMGLGDIGLLMYFNYKGQRIFAFSDTHGMHRNWRIPSDTDILICAGDAISNFSEEDLKDFLSWYSKIPARLRIFVPGNHEILFDYYPEKLKSLFPDNIVCLYDNGMEYEGISFYSISCKTLRSNLYSDTQSPVPAYTDILITHFPPKSILDEDDGNEKLKDWMEKSRPAYHLFGHIHRTGGMKEMGRVNFINISIFI